MSSHGPFEYYQPPQPRHPDDSRRSFSDHHRSQNPTIATSRGQDERVTSTIDANAIPDNLRTAAWSPDMTIRRSQEAQGYASNGHSDHGPTNLRSAAWTPELASPPVHAPQRQMSGSSARAVEKVRRGSVPDRSPLQKLELQLAGKEEKRAKVEQAETRARQKSLGHGGQDSAEDNPRQSMMRNGRTRVVSDGSRRSDDEARKTSEKPRQVSADIPPGRREENGASKFKRASEALKRSPPVEQDGYFPGRFDQAPVANQSRPHSDTPASPQDALPARQSSQQPIASSRSTGGTGNIDRAASAKYKHRARDAGFAGAAAVMAGAGIPTNEDAADRGKAAHERRRSQRLVESPQSSPITSGTTQDTLRRGGSKRTPQQPRSVRIADDGDRGGQQIASPLQTSSPSTHGQATTLAKDPASPRAPMQMTTGRQADQQVAVSSAAPLPAQQKQHHLRGHLHSGERRSYQPPTKPLEEWRTAGTARLIAEDLELNQPSAAGGNNSSSAWWEKKGRVDASQSKVGGQDDGPYEEEAKCFKPPLYLKCGPLLRYTGLKMEAGKASKSSRSSPEREIWRGSVMIVTHDDQSDYSFVPTLRLFAQQMELHTPPSQDTQDPDQDALHDHQDPVAGQVKLSRTGRPLYVRPIHEIDGEVDLSRVENPKGLYAATRTPALGSPTAGDPEVRPNQRNTFEDTSRIRRRDGEKLGRYREVKGARLHTERGCTFWRFNIEVELASKQSRVAYRINKGPAIGFWIPARGETMNIMFHSCNGFSMAVDSHSFSGPDPLWRDVLNRHQSRPFHVMLGGGDQIYNDAAMRDAELFREWLGTKNPEHKHRAEFTSEMQDELETFYLDRYAMWFSQGLFAMANSQIPMVNVWDDHDIIDGFGSYPHHFMSSRVFTGLGAIAFKYYMLFQHQSLVAETENDEPCWLLGASPGPYINELSRSLFMNLGRKVVLLGLDCRTERMRDEILSQDSYDIVFDRCRDEIYKGETKHLIVLLGVPIAYPRLNFLENILTSKVMDPIKALGRTGMLGGFVNKFDGGVEILDDLDDHWTAKHHKAERNWFIQELQELAAEKSVRVTILGGDVHLGAVGQFYTPKSMGIHKDKDHRYMPNVVSSAIVNTPPPIMMADVLNRRNKIHHLDGETDEDLIPMFDTDVDGKKRNNKHLLPRRNYCTIREYLPGSTPPPSPGMGPPALSDGSANDKKFPPGSMKRTMSLTRGPANLVRRLSGSGRDKNPPASLQQEQSGLFHGQSQSGAPPMQRSNSLGSTSHPNSFNNNGQAPPRPGIYRRPTNLSIKAARKAAAKGGADGNLDGREPGHVDLEGGLDISLNMEVDQKDPAGSTVPYRLLIPALWYEGAPDVNTARFKGRRASLMQRIRGRLAPGQQKYEPDRGKDIGEEQETAYDGSTTASPQPSPRPQNLQNHPGGLDSSPATHTMPSRATRQPAPGIAFDGGDGYDSPNNHTPNRSGPGPSRAISSPNQKHSEPGAAYKKGYDLGSPPIGSESRQLEQQQQARRNGPRADNNPYPQSASRRASAPRQSDSQSRPNEQSWNYDDLTDGSLTPEEEYLDAGRPSMQSARLSKPDPRSKGEFNDDEPGSKKKVGWKIWKS